MDIIDSFFSDVPDELKEKSKQLNDEHKSRSYDYSQLIKDAEFEVQYYESEYNKVEGRLFRAKLALEQLQIRQAQNEIV